MSSPPYKSLFSLREALPSTSRTEYIRHLNISRLLCDPLDRINVLGEDGSYGHTGCVNALSWAHNGELLLSGGDDTTVRLWRIDSSITKQEYPFVCRSVINTGHTGNIFNAQLLPYSTHLVTVAGDKQIRVSDINVALGGGVPDGIETQYNMRQCSTKVLRCHSDRVKRIVTEDSPALFLTVSEDGTVRQHDLRTPHNCRQNACPMPLLKLNIDLSTLSLSTLTPYQFVVSGESPYGYLFDRRNIGRRIEEEWGVPSSTEEMTTCVRRFGRGLKPEKKKRFSRDYITGSRMSNYNGHEVLLSYGGDAVYLFSTLDDPLDQAASSTFDSNPSAPGAEQRRLSQVRETETEPGWGAHEAETAGEEEGEEDSGEQSDSEGSSEDEFDKEEAAEMQLNYHPGVPTIMPRKRYIGVRNVDTIKDVNFLGPNDESVVSGSDDGNFFVWDKSSAGLSGIYEGDSSVVNVIEAHPSLPLVAVSGIDTTVKLFAPSKGPSRFSRLGNAEQIMRANARPAQQHSDLRVLFAEAMLRSGSTAECIHQ
ncbi:WD40 repeat-like protein [Macrolepiota fuliginosa MF-IS2]|uniref:WD40 repeat-like protein n=1 Tax=Macrolepiota fuliginosa MF-IS2 TaxID=1400762 RepID=A0A9P5XNS6_9AGAR|nr:WD40 repeat-like protein [Macrolepiota fuliginosa MF-IS2]